MKKIIIILLLSLSLVGCGDNKGTQKYSSNEEVNKILKTENYQIVDVRTKEEYESGHVKGAINIPYDEIDENSNLDKNKTIMVYCRSGKRSAIAYKSLTDMGYTVYDLGAFDSIDLEKE